MNSNVKVCPECNGNIFEEDKTHNETCCRNCGLVLSAPSVYGLFFPGFKIVPRSKRIVIRSTLFDYSIALDYDMN